MKRIWVCAVVLAVMSLSGCKDVNPQLASGDSPSSVYFPLSNISDSLEVQPLFNQACATNGCHDNAGSTPPNLTSYNKFINYKSAGGVLISITVSSVNGKDVRTGDPGSSILIRRVEGQAGYPRMPPYTNMLNDNQINGLRTWIAEGAKNN